MTDRTASDASDAKRTLKGSEEDPLAATVIVCEHLCLTIEESPILTDISFELRRGDFTGLIGPNGGGKTSLLRVILGELQPSSGRVLVLGREPRRLGELRARIGYVPQKAHFDLAFPASAEEVVLMGTYFGVGPLRRVPEEKRRFARYLMSRLGVEKLAGNRIGELSYGQQQRVFIARALVSSPELLILDEPTVGVDVEGQTRFYKQIAELKKELGMTVLMVSHDVAQISEYITHLACLAGELHWHDKSELLSGAVFKEEYWCELDAYLKKHLKHVRDFHNEGGGAE